MVADAKKTFPPGDGIRADDGVDGGEGIADIVRGPAWLGVELESLLACGDWQSSLREGGSEAFEEFTIGGGNFVVDFTG